MPNDEPSEDELLELVRVDRWWSTYDAVMTGLIARGLIPLGERIELHETAAHQAGVAHGPLAPKPDEYRCPLVDCARKGWHRHAVIGPHTEAP